MLIQRIATSLILGPLFIWAIFKMDGDAFAQLLLVFIAIGAWEFSVLIKLQNIVARLVLTISVVVVAVFIS
ncbi:MAG TPA: phosphatidate cytidylyltransferase, partial [Candidatus Thioglobus sp.]|nr:phosphatidate cytidylyltransferase [Candidatus Thioglobus sp.]